ncbi:hypothetical protein PACTADRAFT_69610 [Pachysolen tannophilus NRRL Y-2460]|uniref:Auxin efflux carrier n=1 Tax=Pachysolen tannophilus NRRL Y-2460 TaxID=669874 RepID=A0A1E4TSH9_PACTA|nr:hypothetical protein PACTADRAFT_69610 [Pachysolen tannophilus NRRL Y-2460]
MVSLGSIIYTAVKPIFKIYIIIGVGYFLGKKNLLSVDTTRNISDIILFTLLPCLIFSKIVTNIDNSDLKQIGIICLTAVLLYFAGLIGSLICYFITPVPKNWLGGCLSVGFFPNISDLPIAYVQTLDTGSLFTEDEGDKGVAYVCIYLAVQTIFQFNLGMYRMIEYDLKDEIKRCIDIENKIENSENAIFDSDDDLVQRRDFSVVNSSNINRGRTIHGSSSSNHPTVNRQGGVSKSRTISSNNNEDKEHERFLEANLGNLRGVNRAKSRRLSATQSISNSVMTTSSSVRNLDLRKLPSQNIDDIVNQYSQVEKLRSGTHEATVVGLGDLDVRPVQSRTNKWGLSDFLNALLLVLENCKRPPSVSLILSITISMIPWVKALFVTTTQVSLPNAPDGMPPLSFLMDFATYVSEACVPLGLLLLGATLARLSVGKMPKGYWKVPLSLTLLRLIILPIIGVLFNHRLNKIGWFGGDKMLQFIGSINFGLPNATSLIYLTAFYTPAESSEHIQMDYLALTYIFEYPVLAISLPFLTTYVLKVSLGY